MPVNGIYNGGGGGHFVGKYLTLSERWLSVSSIQMLKFQRKDLGVIIIIPSVVMTGSRNKWPLSTWQGIAFSFYSSLASRFQFNCRFLKMKCER